MEEVRVLTFVNTSRVYQAEKLLRSAGIEAGLRPVPPGVPSRCGLCIRIAAADLTSALEVAGIRAGLEALYQPSPSGGDWLQTESAR